MLLRWGAAVATAVCFVGCSCTDDGSVASSSGGAAGASGRAGKGVTVIAGLPLGPAALEALARELKARCGAGGKARPDGAIEIQGEHRDLLVAELTKRGYAAKRAGG